MSDPSPNPETDPVAPPAEPEQELTDFEQQFMEVIERRFPVSEGTDEPASAEGEDSEPPAAPGGDEPGEGLGEPPPETEPGLDEGEAPVEGDGQPSSVFTLSGHDYTPDQLMRAVQVHDWFARLDPSQVQAIDALISGQYRLAPTQEQVNPQPVVPPGQSPPPPAPSEDEGDWLDPRAQQEIAALKNQLNQMGQVFQNTMTPMIERQQTSDYQVRLNAISSASDSFREKYNLSPEQMNSLESAVVEAQVLPSLANRFQSIEGGMTAALEMFFWTTPDFRDPYLNKRTAAMGADEAVQEQANIRKQQLTALSASGGSAPRREPVPSNQEDRHAAMTAEIAAAMNGSGTVQ